VLRIIVFHELETGLAEEPHWDHVRDRGVSEQYLAEKAMDALVPGSTLVEIVISECFRLSGQRTSVVFRWCAADRRAGAQTAGGPITEEGERR